MYYSNHPKIKALLAEVEGEKLKAESQLKSMKRKGTITSIIKNKYVWSALAIVIGVIIIVHGFAADSMISLLGVYFALGGIMGLIGFATKN